MAPEEEIPIVAPEEEIPIVAPEEEIPIVAPDEKIPIVAPEEEIPIVAPEEESIRIWRVTILWNSMTLTSFVFTELANTMKYGGGVLYNLVFTEWRHWVSQNEVWGGELYNLVFTEWLYRVTSLNFTEWSMGEGCYITLFSPSYVTEFHRMKYEEGCYITLFSPSDVTEFHRMKSGGEGVI